MKKMTVKAFNDEYGKNTWGYVKYKMASKEDVGRFVQMIPNGMTIPYFCEWHESNTYEEAVAKNDMLNSMEIIEIIEEKQLEKDSD